LEIKLLYIEVKLLQKDIFGVTLKTAANKIYIQKLKIDIFYTMHFVFTIRQTLIDNPFDETLQGKEDRYWAIDMVSKNYTYLYDGSQKCNHYWTPNGATWKGIG
jgi:hypothetical protein